jgi:hypothetical protein
MHSTLGYASPIEFEKMATLAKSSCPGNRQQSNRQQLSRRTACVSATVLAGLYFPILTLSSKLGGSALELRDEGLAGRAWWSFLSVDHMHGHERSSRVSPTWRCRTSQIRSRLCHRGIRRWYFEARFAPTVDQSLYIFRIPPPLDMLACDAGKAGSHREQILNGFARANAISELTIGGAPRSVHQWPGRLTFSATLSALR